MIILDGYVMSDVLKYTDKISGEVLHIDVRWNVTKYLNPLTNTLHRLDGPAYLEGDYEAYYIDGKMYSQEEHSRRVKLLNFS